MPLTHPPTSTPKLKQAQYQAWGYPFDYIKPTNFPDAMAKLYSGPAADIPGTGPAPMLMRASDWKKVCGGWGRGRGERPLLHQHMRSVCCDVGCPFLRGQATPRGSGSLTAPPS